jgi:hypothetical protein
MACGAAFFGRGVATLQAGSPFEWVDAYTNTRDLLLAVLTGNPKQVTKTASTDTNSVIQSQTGARVQLTTS